MNQMRNLRISHVLNELRAIKKKLKNLCCHHEGACRHIFRCTACTVLQAELVNSLVLLLLKTELLLLLSDLKCLQDSLTICTKMMMYFRRI